MTVAAESMPEALQAVAREALEQADNTLIDKLNRSIRDLAAQDLALATVMAAFNCQLARYKGDAIVWGRSNFVMGWLYLQQDELELADHHCQKALSVFEPLSWAQKTVAQIRCNVGEIRERQNDLKAARHEYQKALPLVQKKVPQLEGDGRNGLGRVYLAQEQADVALGAFRQALKLSQKSDDRRGRETALGNLGRAYHFLGRLNAAKKRYQKAIALSREIGHQAGTGRHLNNLGNVQIELGELSEAEKCFEEALEIADQLHDRQGKQQRLGNLGSLYQAQAKRERDPQRRDECLLKAGQRHGEAVTIARERNDQRGQATHLLNQGNAYRKLGQREAAEGCYLQALTLAKAPVRGMVDTRWRIRCAWGALCAAERQDRLAYKHLAAAIKIVEDQRNELKIESRTKFWQERAILYKRMVLCCLRQGELWPALVYTERAKARYLADLLTRHAPPTGDTQEIIQTTLKALPPRTAAVVFNVTEEGAVVFIVADRFETSPPDDGWRQSSDGRIWARRFEGLNRDALQRLLVEVDDSGQATGGYLVDYFASRAQWMNSTLESASAEIYEALLAPVHCKLARLLVKCVIFMPNLGLSLLPLHACQTGQGYLLDHYEITYAPSFGVLHHCQARTPSEQPGDGSLFAVSNPTGDLVWAGVEVERISGLLPTAQKVDGGNKTPATVEAVVAGSPGHTFVHFACHGKFELRDPLRSCLRLAPPESLSLAMILSRLKLPQTQLVVMSACETSLVDPGDLADEYMGLPGGFVLAGAPAVVSTLWAVNDLSTALLMERFYENLLRGDPDEDSNTRSPLPPAEALRRAQIWLRDEMTAQEIARRCEAQIKEFEGRKELVPPWLSRAKRKYTRMTRKAPASRPFAHPFYWAAFVLSGSTNNRR
jgi:CHAT domain-containing protein/tetratricopeptide (TPR) repeat protein